MKQVWVGGVCEWGRGYFEKSCTDWSSLFALLLHIIAHETRWILLFLRHETTLCKAKPVSNPFVLWLSSGVSTVLCSYGGLHNPPDKLRFFKKYCSPANDPDEIGTCHKLRKCTVSWIFMEIPCPSICIMGRNSNCTAKTLTWQVWLQFHNHFERISIVS